MQAWDDAQHRHIPHSVMARSIVASDTGTVQHERHTRVVQCAIHHDLVECPVQEGRIHSHHRVQSPEGQTRSARRRMLLGDTNVIGAIRVARCESLQAGGPEHRCGDRDNVGLVAPDLEHLVSED